MDHNLSVNILKFDVKIAFSSGLARSYLDFLLSFGYPLKVGSHDPVLVQLSFQIILCMMKNVDVHTI